MSEKKSFFKRKKKLLIVGAAVLIIGLIIVFNFQAKREKTVKVTVENVKKHDLTATVSASGEVKPRKNVNISAHVAGRIEKIGVVEGQRVKEGDFLLKLDSTQYEAFANRDQALIQAYKADLIRATAVLQKDTNFFERQKKLYDESLISKDQLEAAKAQDEISKAQQEAILFQIKQAEASLHSALDTLSKTVYSSPINGMITSLRVEEGEIAMIGTMNNPGTILMTIADLSVMEVEVDVDETDVISVHLGQTAEVKIDALPNQVIQGKVTEIGSSALQKTTVTAQESKDFKVVVTLENPPESLKPGLSASADIITGEKKDVLAVPISSLVIREKKAEEQGAEDNSQEEGVYIVKDSRVTFTPVKKGIMGGMLIEITGGLEEGETVVVGPYNALRQLKDGMLIKEEAKKAET